MATLGISRDNLITGGAARYSDLVYLSLEDKGLKKKGKAHTRLGSIDGGEVGTVADVAWRTAGCCVVHKPKEQFVAVSPDGRVLTYVGGEKLDERIEGATEIRGARAIDGYAYAFGMNREVFFRGKAKQWTAMHATPARNNEVVGFEDLAGDGKLLYAVGWEGEIWRYAKKVWAQVESPTSKILSAVVKTDDAFFACGQGGTLLRGDDDGWTQLKSGVGEDLWDLCWFEGALYASSMSNVYRLDGDSLAVVPRGKGTFDAYRLTSAQGVMWSVGQKNVLSLQDGKWTRLE
ncbi:hypothetical protein AKJ09_06834 [Labilithrix luteola]|uniref:Uncharacterized protein n=1 Tax=Labilithrix luteola TaxID=1391654 RepID=A0A0K1Q2Y1_9BACT|nr:hypothetical protein [Labilithrix luteola]AKV00171.1 hypothetical protein AKJ09_06834 [Labilithrix luteola]